MEITIFVDKISEKFLFIDARRVCLYSNKFINCREILEINNN